MLVLDIEQYSKRSDSEQMDLRDVMYQALYHAMDESGLSRGQFLEFERGDAVLIAVPDSPQIARRQFVDPFIPCLHGALSATSGAMPLRMRMAMHCGDIEMDDRDGAISGHAVIETFRVCDSPQLRRVLAASRRSRLAVAASDVWYQTVLRPNHDLLPVGTYRSAEVVTEKYRGRVWLHVPGYDSPMGVDEPDAEASGSTPRAAVADDRGGAGLLVGHIDNGHQQVTGNQFQANEFNAERINFGAMPPEVGGRIDFQRIQQDLDQLIVDILCGSYTQEYARTVIVELASARRAVAAEDLAKVRVCLGRASDAAAPVTTIVASITACERALTSRP